MFVSTSEDGPTWLDRYKQYAKKKKNKIIICTYSVPSEKYVHEMFDLRSKNVTLIVNEKFTDKAIKIADRYPDMTVIACNDMHAKIMLVEPDVVWLSSENFGYSSWFEESIGFISPEGYRYYKEKISEHIGIKL